MNKALIKDSTVLIIGNTIEENILDNGRANYIAYLSDGTTRGISATGTIVSTEFSDTVDASSLIYINGTIREKNDIIMSAGRFIGLFDPSEWRKFKAAIVQDDLLNQFYDSLTGYDFIDLRDEAVQKGMQYAVSIGVISSDKYQEIYLGIL